MAVVDGRLLAAASLADGRIVADPFAETEQAVRLLRLRSAALAGDEHPRVRRGRASRCAAPGRVARLGRRRIPLRARAAEESARARRAPGGPGRRPPRA